MYIVLAVLTIDIVYLRYSYYHIFTNTIPNNLYIHTLYIHYIEISSPSINMVSHLMTTKPYTSNTNSNNTNTHTHKSSLLVTSPPTGLTHFSLNTYKPITSYPGITMHDKSDGAGLSKGLVSSDGKYVVCSGLNNKTGVSNNISITSPLPNSI